MDIVPLGPGFAAELRGVTLADIAADDAAYQTVRAAFEEHSVLVFRGQNVTDEVQIAFSRRFGPLEVTPAATEGAGTNLVILSTVDKDGKVVPADHRLALRNKANQLWHADSTFKSVPALASVLSGRIMPPQGGETEYVSTRLAWERLDPAMQKRIADLFAWHDYSHSRGKIAANIVGAAEHRFARSRDRGDGGGRGAKAHRRVHRGRDRTGTELRARLAQGRRRHVGQPRDAASRPTLARA